MTGSKEDKKKYKEAQATYKESKSQAKKALDTTREETGRKTVLYNPLTWRWKQWLILFILLLCSAVVWLSFEYHYKLEYIKELEQNQRKYSNWPDQVKDKAFSIKHQDLDLCLQPGEGENEANLTLRQGCDEDNIRFKKLYNNRIQQYIPPSKVTSNTVKKCLISAGTGDQIIYSNDCSKNDGEILYEDSKIKVKKNDTDYCYNVESGSTLVKLGDCNNATKFDLI